MELKKLTSFLDDLLLRPCQCDDASNNGLQVEGSTEVSRIVLGVDACAALFEQAVAASANLVIVHHGLSWGDSLSYLTGINANRLRLLFQHGISLYAAHLPLDMHPEVGHNAVIADRLQVRQRRPFHSYHGSEIGWSGELPEGMPLAALANAVNRLLNTDAAVLGFGAGQVRSVGIVSGGAADAVSDCAAAGLDCLITGEMTHTHYHTALECGVNVIAAGHYRSEIPGLTAVQQCLEAAFPVECRFIDIPTGY
jgi:dinuclear metal center YbgI/SA1388 family protein